MTSVLMLDKVQYCYWTSFVSPSLCNVDE